MRQEIKRRNCLGDRASSFELEVIRSDPVSHIEARPMQLAGDAGKREETFFRPQKECHEHLVGAQMTRYNVESDDGSKSVQAAS